MSFDYLTKDFIFDHTVTTKIKEEAPKDYIYPTAIYENFRRAAKNIIDDELNKNIPNSDRKHRVTLYTLRHTAATKIVSKLGIKVAKEYLNHSDLKVTEIYAKVLDKQMEEAAEVL